MLLPGVHISGLLLRQEIPRSMFSPECALSQLLLENSGSNSDRFAVVLLWVGFL